MIKLLPLILLIASCSSSNTKRTKFTDKSMRVMIDPKSLNVKDYVSVQASLVASGKWAVIDRSSGFEAIKREQEMLHRKKIDRFADREKWAHWGKLYGVGGVVVGHAQCFYLTRGRYGKGWIKKNGPHTKCSQFLNIVDSNTGEVIAAIENTTYADGNTRPNWKESVEKLNIAFPEDFKPVIHSEKLEQYKLESKESAIRQKEKKAQSELKK